MDANIDALTALIQKSDPKRIARSDDRPMDHFRWTGEAWEGLVTNDAGVEYRPRINLLGCRSFNCTCPDKRSRARRVGPCKHVISLAKAGLTQMAAFAG